MIVHAPLAPSAAHRWIPCPASVQAEKSFPDPPMKRETALGCAMHEVRARCLKYDLHPKQFEGWPFLGGTRIPHIMTKERLDFLLPGIARWCELTANFPTDPGHYLIEETLTFDERRLEEVFGTLDAGAFVDTTIVISDLKFGIGVPVYAKDNEQQLIYAGLFYDQLERKDQERVESVHIIIDQPRNSDGGGEWIIKIDQLRRWIDEVLHPAVEATKARNPKYGPGPKACIFCKAKPTCEAWREYNLETLGVTFEDARDSKALTTRSMSAERRSYILQRKKMIEDFLDALEAEALGDALAGRPCPGFKAGYGNKGKRVWANEAEAGSLLQTLLHERAWIKRYLSPTEAEKELPSLDLKKLAPLWTQAPAAPKLLPEASNKPAIPVVEMQDVRGKHD